MRDTQPTNDLFSPAPSAVPTSSSTTDPEQARSSSTLSNEQLRDAGFELVASAAPFVSREGVIDSIRSINPTAPVEYLAGFDVHALVAYLERLLRGADPRSSAKPWVRTTTEPAISWSLA